MPLQPTTVSNKRPTPCVDLMTSYKATENIDIRLNLNNVFDKKYYQSIGTNTVYGSSQYGDPRNAMVTVRWSL